MFEKERGAGFKNTAEGIVSDRRDGSSITPDLRTHSTDAGR
jgi:hypothetical protein